jgi:hypothetical protein
MDPALTTTHAASGLPARRPLIGMSGKRLAAVSTANGTHPVSDQVTSGWASLPRILDTGEGHTAADRRLTIEWLDELGRDGSRLGYSLSAGSAAAR